MKIKEIVAEHINEHLDAGFVSGNTIDPEVEEVYKRLRQIEDGIDPDFEEIVQDLPV